MLKDYLFYIVIALCAVFLTNITYQEPATSSTSLAKAQNIHHLRLLRVPSDQLYGKVMSYASQVSNVTHINYGRYEDVYKTLSNHPSVRHIPGCTPAWHGMSYDCHIDPDSVPYGRYVVMNLDAPTAAKFKPRVKAKFRAHDYSDPRADGHIVPETVRNLHEIPDLKLSDRVIVGPVEYQGDRGWNAEDLEAWAKSVGQTTPIPTLTYGGPGNGMDIENLLDLLAACGVAHGATCTQLTFINWLLEMASFLSAHGLDFFNGYPTILTNSWGWRSSRICEDIVPEFCAANNLTSTSYHRLVEFHLAIVAATQPTSILFSSGDAGDWTRAEGGETCNAPNLGCPYAACSAWATAVGAVVDVNDTVAANFTAPACKNSKGRFAPCASGTSGILRPIQYGGPPDGSMFWTSGGGFDWIETCPVWQKDVVDEYLAAAENLPPTNMFNSSNRASPDLVSVGHNWYLYAGGALMAVDGTSMSSPILAAALTYINQARVNAGRPGLGFANPWLYMAAESCPDCFIKIDPPGFDGCTETMCCKVGFHSATTRWDSVTGLGFPRISKLLDWDNQMFEQRETYGIFQED